MKSRTLPWFATSCLRVIEHTHIQTHAVRIARTYGLNDSRNATACFNSYSFQAREEASFEALAPVTRNRLPLRLCPTSKLTTAVTTCYGRKVWARGVWHVLRPSLRQPTGFETYLPFNNIKWEKPYIRDRFRTDIMFYGWILSRSRERNHPPHRYVSLLVNMWQS